MPTAALEATLTDLAVADGTLLKLRRWTAPPHPRGTVLVVHGLGEHSGRYQHVAQHLHDAGWAVLAYDQRGHGLSPGLRGGLRRPDDLLTDLATVLDAAHTLDPQPVILLGHSMGGLVAARFVAARLRPVAGLVLSSPALDAGLTPMQRALLVVMHALAPGLPVPNGLDVAALSHDPAVVQAYRDDPLVHGRVTPRLVRFIVDAGLATRATAPRWQVPTLLMWAGSDRLVNPQGSQQFVDQAPPDVVQAHCFKDHYHELFNEVARAPVLAMLTRWLDERFPR
jgi:alpha-beta hydrolase superfamily lysophospholipase